MRLGFRLVKGLKDVDAAQLVTHRGEQPYTSIEELWRRAGIPTAMLERLAEADAFEHLGLDRRQALWAVRGLAETTLPLFAAADGVGQPQPELVEPPIRLRPMKAGGEVVEDYRSTGLTLRKHPVSFLRGTLRARRMVACSDLQSMRDGRKVIVPGIVLVRQKPGSAKGVMFITIEDETGVANLVLWADRFEKQRRLVLSADMIACHGEGAEGGGGHPCRDRPSGRPVRSAQNCWKQGRAIPNHARPGRWRDPSCRAGSTGWSRGRSWRAAYTRYLCSGPASRIGYKGANARLQIALGPRTPAGTWLFAQSDGLPGARPVKNGFRTPDQSVSS